MKKTKSREIAETYIHINYDYELKQKSHDEIKLYLETNSQEWAKKYFKQPIEITITVEDGSLKTWITVAGLIYAGVAGYGSFRSGIDYMVKDAKSFSDYVIEEFYQHENTPQHDIIRDERRLGIPGKIQRLFKKSDKLDNLNNLNDRNELVEELRFELTNILDLIDNQEDKELLLENVRDEIVA